MKKRISKRLIPLGLIVLPLCMLDPFLPFGGQNGLSADLQSYKEAPDQDKKSSGSEKSGEKIYPPDFIQENIETFQGHKKNFQYSCDFREIPQEAKVPSIKVRQGTAISTVTTVGQGMLVSTVSIHIEKNSSPFSLVVISHFPVIWQFTGRTQAVQQVIVYSAYMNQNYDSVSGVAGLKKVKVKILNHLCLPAFYQEPEYVIQSVIDRPLATMAGNGSHGFYGLQEGKFRKDFEMSAFSLASERAHYIFSKYALIFGGKPVSDGFHPKIWMKLLEKFPDGVAHINLDFVVAAGSVEPYKVLPGRAGLAKLAFEGFINIGPRAIKILQPIPKFPANVFGRVILSENVPIPEGIPKNSCVMREHTGEVLQGSHCFY